MFLCEDVSYVLFGVGTVGVCFYTARLRNLHAQRVWPCVVACLTLATFVTLTALHTMSNCSRMFLTWGGGLVAVYGVIATVELCLCVSRETPDEEPEVAPAPVTARTGTVVAVGALAATVVETNTRRQYYASREDWPEPLCLRDTVVFLVDTERYSGEHRVGQNTYKRHYCTPAERMVQDESIAPQKTNTP